MPCLLGCLALFTPRLVIVLVWLFSDWLEQAYNNVSVLWPILGFLFMPLTTLAYALAWHMQPVGTVPPLGIVVIVIAVLIDLGIIGGSASSRKAREYVIVRKRV